MQETSIYFTHVCTPEEGTNVLESNACVAIRYFNFDVKRMCTPCSRAFEENILAVCGLQQAGAPNSLLSSLPSELTFNQMRDCARRHSKHERCQPSSLHAVAWKAATKHPCGCANLDLDDNDWAVPLKQSEIKKSVHQNLRSTDKEMGINSEGLTKHKVVKHFTKPHVFTDRLELLDFIVKRFKEFPGDQEQKRGEILRARKAMWFSKLVPELWFLRRRSEDQSEVPENCLIVIGAGPYLVDCAGCSHVTNANYSLQATPPVKVLVDGLNTVEVAQCVPKSDGGHLRWSKGGPWIDLPTYTCDFGILSIGVQLLSQLCSALKIPSHQKLDHRHRVELFLKFMKKSDAYIAEILEQLVVPSRKKLADTEEESVMLHVSVFANVCTFRRICLSFSCPFCFLPKRRYWKDYVKTRRGNPRSWVIRFDGNQTNKFYWVVGRKASLSLLCCVVLHFLMRRRTLTIIWKARQAMKRCRKHRTISTRRWL